MKSIYSFTVNLVKEVEKKTKEKRTNKKTGQKEEVEVSRKVEEKVPYEIIIKEPNRRELEDADMEYSIEISRCIKKGILTKAMLAKKYSDTGGILTEKDAGRLVDLYGELAQLETEAAKLGIKTILKEGDKSTSKAKKIHGSIAMTRRQIVELESAYQSLFNHTADIKAQNRVILWYLLKLTFYKGSGVDGTSPMFKGKDFDARVEDYYDKDEIDEELFRLVQPRLAALISFWYFSAEPTKEDFARIVRDLTPAPEEPSETEEDPETEDGPETEESSETEDDPETEG